MRMSTLAAAAMTFAAYKYMKRQRTERSTGYFVGDDWHLTNANCVCIRVTYKCSNIN